jgi:hypothetical protein
MLTLSQTNGFCDNMAQNTLRSMDRSMIKDLVNNHTGGGSFNQPQTKACLDLEQILELAERDSRALREKMDQREHEVHPLCVLVLLQQFNSSVICWQMMQMKSMLIRRYSNSDAQAAPKKKQPARSNRNRRMRHQQILNDCDATTEVPVISPVPSSKAPSCCSSDQLEEQKSLLMSFLEPGSVSDTVASNSKEKRSSSSPQIDTNKDLNTLDSSCDPPSITKMSIGHLRMASPKTRSRLPTKDVSCLPAPEAPVVAAPPVQNDQLRQNENNQEGGYASLPGETLRPSFAQFISDKKKAQAEGL